MAQKLHHCHDVGAFTPCGTLSQLRYQPMMTSSNGNIFRVTGPLWGEFTGHRWIPLTSQWRGALMFSLIWPWTNGRINNRDAGDLRHHCVHDDVTVILASPEKQIWSLKYVNKLWPRQNGRHFADGVFECIFFSQNVLIFINISSNFFAVGPFC